MSRMINYDFRFLERGLYVAYLALYRAWRPRNFSEVVGQEKTVTALKNAVKEERLSHAYLFSGPRGTGKTSIAKIVARAANCSNVKDGEPCNTCSSCTDIDNGNFMDVIEIDAASNRGIDEIRELRERVRILPAQGKKKVYIIDEVHMLTTEAFNALLKTIEEPPDSVIFILATTEPQRIPATILSRCQSYNFRRLTIEEIMARLKQVAASSEISIEEDALKIIARRANGGLRDALSSLDQIYSYKGHRIERADVLDVMGLVDDKFLSGLLNEILDGNPAGIINMLSTALNEGKEAQQLARETAMYIRDLMVFGVMGQEAELSVVTDSVRADLEKQAARVKQQDALAILRILMNTADRLRFSEGNRFQLEIAFLEIMSYLSASPRKEAKKQPASTAVTRTPVKEAEAGEKNEARDVLWDKILTGVKEKKIPTHALLVQGKFLGSKGDNIYIGYQKAYKFHKEKMEEKPNREILEEVLQNLLGRSLKIEFIFLEEERDDTIVQKALEHFGPDKVIIKD